ncbi:hypothetical protein LJC63_10635 [Ruminococcaceae bacterium OttesenSCG-928-L11]|nr:hypothetical protein [Ruminococcaceae bacterium OttesenSCG-928-L11]
MADSPIQEQGWFLWRQMNMPQRHLFDYITTPTACKANSRNSKQLLRGLRRPVFAYKKTDRISPAGLHKNAACSHREQRFHTLNANANAAAIKPLSQDMQAVPAYNQCETSNSIVRIGAIIQEKT